LYKEFNVRELCEIKYMNFLGVLADITESNLFLGEDNHEVV
jgi:hypothetical protein